MIHEQYLHHHLLLHPVPHPHVFRPRKSSNYDVFCPLKESNWFKIFFLSQKSSKIADFRGRKSSKIVLYWSKKMSNCPGESLCQKGLSGYQINIAPNTIFHIQTGGSHDNSLLSILQMNGRNLEPHQTWERFC